MKHTKTNCKIKSKDRLRFNILGGIIIGLIAVICLFPFVLIVSGSFSDEKEVLTNGYSIIPRGFSLEAYKSLFVNVDTILRCYGNTILITIVGTIGGLIVSSMAAYVLHRRDFKWRNICSFILYFTTLFSGGIVPWYMMIVGMGLKNNLWAVILPTMVSFFHITILKNYMMSISTSITESAKLDGANDFQIYLRVILPMSKPVLATVALYLALQYWNEWYNCMLFITEKNFYTLQYYLYNMLNSSATMKDLMASGAQVGLSNYTVPSQTAKLAMTVISTGPILLAYPFVQKYFVRGMNAGAVKE